MLLCTDVPTKDCVRKNCPHGHMVLCTNVPAGDVHAPHLSPPRMVLRRIRPHHSPPPWSQIILYATFETDSVPTWDPVAHKCPHEWSDVRTNVPMNTRFRYQIVPTDPHLISL